MLYVFAVVLAWLPPIVGFGSVLQYAPAPELRRAVSGMLGLAIMGTIGTILHFGVSLNPLVGGAIWIAGAGLFWVRRLWLAEGLSKIELAAFILAPAVFVALIQPPGRLYDDGLYYLQAVRWTAERPLQIGLVNLYGPLAYNNSWFVLSALLEHPLASKSASALFVTILPLTFAVVGAVAAARRLFSGDYTFANTAMVAMVIPAAHAAEGLGAQAPDQALTVIIPFVLILVARSVATPDGELEAAMILSAFVVTVKLSAAPVFFGSAAVLARRLVVTDRKRLVVLFSLLALMGASWTVRSMLLSGCVAYPLAMTCIDAFRWTPSADRVHAEADAIRAWARQQNRPPEYVLRDWSWLPLWVEKRLSALNYLLIAALVAVSLAAFVVAVTVTRRSERSAAIGVVAIALSGVAYWFLAAPDPRFALGYFFSLVVVPLGFVASCVLTASRGSGRALLVGAAVAAAAAMIWSSGVLRLALTRPWPIPALSRPAVPVTYTVKRTTRTGYEVSVPSRTDQCWANPPPCTPRYDPELGYDWAFVRMGQMQDFDGAADATTRAPK